MRLYDFWPIKIDHLSSKILVSRGLFLMRPLFIEALLSPFDINSPSIKTLSKLLQEFLKNIRRTLEDWKSKWRRFIQIILPNFKFLLESSPKASRKFKNFDQLKIHPIQAKSPEELQHTIFRMRIRRTFKEHKEQRISKQAKV